MRQAFLTGGTGFVGSHVMRVLLEAGVAVRALVRPAYAVSCDHQVAELLAQDGVEIVEGDLLDPATWASRLRGCDTLFHVAGFYSAQPSDVPQLYTINVTGTRVILDAAATAGVGRVVHTSTIGTIGQPADGSLATEETPFNLWPTSSDYVRSKWLGEAVALLWNRRGLPAVVVHPTAPVGVGDWKPTITGQRIVDFLAGCRPEYPRGGMNLCPVIDMAKGHLLAAQLGQPGRRYILGHATGNLDEAAFLDLLSRASGLPIPPPVPQPAGRRPLALTADPMRAIVELGLPQSELRLALQAAVDYYRT